jgi:hypothetical protein
MEFLKFENIGDKKREELVELAYKHYYFELDELYFTENLISPFGKLPFSECKKVIDSMLIERIPKHTEGYNKVENTSLFLFENNPANFDDLTCYKLLLCSEFLSFRWYIPYTSFYKFYYDTNKYNKDIDVDLFIAKIKELYEKDHDIQFAAFEKLTNLKYKKIKLDEI